MIIESRFLGSDGYRYARFEAISDQVLSLEEVAAVQKEHGYHPAGYGMGWIASKEQREDGNLVSIIQCMGSCD